MGYFLKEVDRVYRSFNNDRPIYIQVRELIENMIITGDLKENEQAPSTTDLSNFYKINHITVAKGINQLADEGILYKKRGVGTFVASKAREKLLAKRKNEFTEKYIRPMLDEGANLGLTKEEIDELIQNDRRNNDE